MTDVVDAGVASRPHWPGRYVEVAGRTLHVRRTAPDGELRHLPPAVLVHGLGGSATNWTDLMAVLGTPGDPDAVVDPWAVDLPGFGFSPPPADGDYSLEALAGVVVALLEHVRAEHGVDRVHLAGNSLGGAVVTLVAAEHPDLLASLTLVSPALPVLRPMRSNVHLPVAAIPRLGERLLDRAARQPVERRLELAMAAVFAEPAAVPPDRRDWARDELVRRAALDYETEATLRSLRGLLVRYLDPGPRGLWRVAARVRTPTLLVQGLRDRLVAPRAARRATRFFPQLRLMLLPGSGHVPQMEHPQLVAGTMRTFLREVGCDPSRAGMAVSPLR